MEPDRRGSLRFLTAGSVDDGKSTLIGRLLYDARAIYRDQWEAVEAASAAKGGPVDFSLLTDGLHAEREQGITIDVAYRYFSTARRKFIVADSPGHEQYTRNLATGASTASLALLLMDAQKGVLPQTCRHAAIARLMGIRNFAIAVNKMDLAGFRAGVFHRIEREFREFLTRLGPTESQFIPCCAPDGDNVVHRSPRTPWYDGPCVLDYLETVALPAEPGANGVRFPVQYVVRGDSGARWYAGEVAAGILREGTELMAASSGRGVRVKAILDAGSNVESAERGRAVAIELDRDIDLGRGDMLVDLAHPPARSRQFRATLLWMAEEPLAIGRPYLVKHTTRYACGSVSNIAGIIDPVTLERRQHDTLGLNEFADVEVETHQALYIDPYDVHRVSGSFILVEPISNATVAAGTIAAPVEDAAESARQAAGTGMAVWFTGMSSAGKSTISKAVYEKLWAKGYKVELLDGDIVRQHLSRDLGFSKEDRDENIRRIGFMAELLTRNGVIVLAAAISPYRAVRDEVRTRIGNFVEVYVHAPLAVLEQRDIKGLYRRFRAGEIRGVTGLDDPYEPPLSPEVECRTAEETLAESVDKVLRAIEGRLRGVR